MGARRIADGSRHGAATPAPRWQPGRGIAALLAAASLLTGCASGPAPVSPPPAATPAATRAAPPRAGNAPFYQVAGRRYHVLADAAGYRERGVASWYGRQFHGRPTASGEIYDMHALTAAHKTLPIPSFVRVRNLHNGSEVVVRVNDRGPFVKNRLIDLSYEAARRLDLIGPGTGLVEVVVIADPAQAARAATMATRSPTTDARALTAAAPEAAAQGRPATGYPAFFVQVGAFGDAGNAERMRTRLLGLGFDNVVVHRADPPEPAYRVKVGPFTDVAAYDEILERMRLVDIHDTFLTTR